MNATGALAHTEAARKLKICNQNLPKPAPF